MGRLKKKSQTKKTKRWSVRLHGEKPRPKLRPPRAKYDMETLAQALEQLEQGRVYYLQEGCQKSSSHPRQQRKSPIHCTRYWSIFSFRLRWLCRIKICINKFRLLQRRWRILVSVDPLTSVDPLSGWMDQAVTILRLVVNFVCSASGETRRPQTSVFRRPRFPYINSGHWACHWEKNRNYLPAEN